ncbi:RNA-directed DNA polymerase [Clostridium formicaceticum]|uniref:Reverse transcriptase (RNA-dependent DNA polymerase) n=1 Tax=Clostridium formicaceticum TaxID=1497 RepID=A0AAC9RPK3_9CLOT|nr:RNA-directed DNA polymerase [Clostridium formicaceticum]AOY75325.1 hypothetical protein BJL90_05055 [Clostridium formicaceticum]ARE89771.1 Reverse transcriptase (RNA-dependent DNA polymerase) [Clostridium formicaceticum]
MDKHVFLLTDTLPNELPLIFSNRRLYAFITSNLSLWKGLEISKDSKDSKEKEYDRFFQYSIPLQFFIAKNENEIRKMSLLHPYAQLQITKFIEIYDEHIVDYFQQNVIYSVRTPISINDIFNNAPDKYKQELKWMLNSSEEDLGSEIEEFVKNYFVLNRFSKITDFYKSYKMKDLEMKYTYLIKLDYQECFNSIYTHSLDWAYLGDRDIAKNYISSKYRFSALLDKVAQTINYNETNGIVIGPEFSRTLAEFILVRIDNLVYQELDKQDIIFRKDYEIVRFIDDIFIFFNDNNVGCTIEKTISKLCLDYKMTINNKKRMYEVKPFLRNQLWISKVKNELNIFFDYFRKDEVSKKRYPYDKFFENVRLVVVEYETHKRYIISYILSAIERKLTLVIEEITKTKEIDIIEYNFSKLLDLLIYILNHYIGTENVIRISRIILMLQRAADMNNLSIDDLLFKKIYNTLKYNLDKFTELHNFIIVLTFNLNHLPEQFIVQCLGKYRDYFSLSVITYYIIKKSSDTINYNCARKIINNIIADTIYEMKNKYNLNSGKASNQSSFDKFDKALLSDFFYIIHDFYSSGILNNQNLDAINKIKRKLSKSKDSRGMELYNIFLGYIDNFDKPFMNWDASYEDITKEVFAKKYKVINVYE